MRICSGQGWQLINSGELGQYRKLIDLAARPRVIA
jgi:hypothetical protein